MLDERFRQRVGALSRIDDAPSLDDAASERIVARLVAEGPLVVRRARRARIAFLSAGPVLAAAAAVAVLVRSAEQPVLEGVRSPVAAPAPLAACSAREAPAGAAFQSKGQGSELDLGRTALVRAAPQASVRVVEASSCRTAIALDSGTVMVHAKDLGGGELVVQARDGEVAVRGTVFAVTQTADAFLVEVSEGRVRVTDRSGAHTVEKGQRHALRGGLASESLLGGERDGEIRQAVGLTKIVGFDSLEPAPAAPVAQPEGSTSAARSQRGASPPAAQAGTEGRVEAVNRVEPEGEPSAPEAAPAARVDLLAEADAARQAGRYDAARDLYRRAASGQGATAEAAWVALARMELTLGNAAQARAATKQRQQRFGQGTLAPESLWIDVRAYRQTGELGLARELAAELVRRWPGSPQARAAQDWLSGAR